MTLKQAQLLEFIRDYMASHGHSPSMQDMATGVKLKSKGSVSRRLDCLRRDGLIDWQKNIARSVRLVDLCSDDIATINTALLKAELKRRGFTVVNPMSSSAAEGL